MILLPIHIIAGLIAIAAGFVALYTVKGMKRHRKSGTVFVYAMLVLAGTGATIAAIKSQPANVMGGLMSIYLVTTGVLTLRARDGAMRVIDAASLAAAIALAFLSTRLAFEIARSPTGTMNGLPPAPLFAFAAVATLGAIGDLRVILTRGLQGTQRIARHLWRMCFALFIAAGSFFSIRERVLRIFPEPLATAPMRALPIVLLFGAMFYWLWRVRRRRALPVIVRHDSMPH